MKVNPDKLMRALIWLTGKDENGIPNNVHYQHVKINKEYLDRLRQQEKDENGYVVPPDLKQQCEYEFDSKAEKDKENTNSNAKPMKRHPKCCPAPNQNARKNSEA